MSHDRGCFVCQEDPSEYARCQRANCPKRRTTTRIMPDRMDPEGGVPGRGDSRPPIRGRLSRRIVSVTNPGHDVLIFMHADGTAHAVISKPGDEQPITVFIAKPEPGRCIAVQRRGTAFDVVYKDEEQL